MKISIQGLEHKFADKKLFTNLNLAIKPGQTFGIIGKNGSGKSTLAKYIAGFLKPKLGTVKIGCFDTKNYPISFFPPYVGYVLQNPDNQIFAANVYQELAFGLKLLHRNHWQ